MDRKENKVLWFDFENTPHVWILKEIINYFKSKGYLVIITSRNYQAILSLSSSCGIETVAIGSSKKYKTSIGKLISIISRSFALKHYIKMNNLKPSIAISHGSRSQALACFLMRIPAISLDDYEFSFKWFNLFVEKLMTPFAIEKEEWGRFSKKVVHYPGLKEELYLWNKDNYSGKGVDEYIKDDKVNVIFRPEGMHTHYANSISGVLQEKVIDIFRKVKDIHVVLIAREKDQEKNISAFFQNMGIEYIIPNRTINGPLLISKCDAVFSGGGTMCREAAVLNVPSYSFFGGSIGGVDTFLESNKKLIVLKNGFNFDENTIKKKAIEDKTEVSDYVYMYLCKYLEDYLNSR